MKLREPLLTPPGDPALEWTSLFVRSKLKLPLLHSSFTHADSMEFSGTHCSL